VAGWALPVVVTAMALATGVGLVVAGSAAGAVGKGGITRSVHLAYENCPAKDVVLTVTAAHRAYARGVPVTYTVKLQNVSDQACSFPGTTQPTVPNGPSVYPGGRSLTPFMLGPCSPLPVTIDTAKGVDISPGPDAISCPAILGPPLAAHATLSAAGTWDQMEGGLRPARIQTPVPPGRYLIEVDGKVGVPITIASPNPPAAVTSAP